MKLYKISKRKEIDTSTFRAAIRIDERGGLIRSAAVAFSGVGPTAARLPQTESFLVGQLVLRVNVPAGGQAGARPRSSRSPTSAAAAEFRLQLAENILLKFHHEVAGAAPGGRRWRMNARRPARQASVGRPGVPHEAARVERHGHDACISTTFRPFATSSRSSSSAARWPTPRIISVDVAARPARPGSRRVFTAADVPGDNRFGPIVHDEELLAALECRARRSADRRSGGRNSRGSASRRSEAVKLELEPLPAVLRSIRRSRRASFWARRGGSLGVTCDPALAAAEHRDRGQPSHRRAGALLPGDAGGAGRSRRTRVDLGLFLDAEPERDPGDGRALPGPAPEPGRLHCDADGRGFRRQGIAGRPSRGCRVARGLQDRPAGPPGLSRATSTCGSRASGIPTSSRYRAGFDPTGGSTALVLELYSDGGSRLRPFARRDGSLDPARRQCVLHSPFRGVSGTVCRTNLPPNTAMRGFGAPQGIAAIENVIEDVAAFLGIDPLLVRRRNCYGGAGRDVTPYGQVVVRQHAAARDRELAESSDYASRRDEAARWNAASLTHLRGLSLVPVKFGISFTRRTLNQAMRSSTFTGRHDPGFDRRDRDGAGSLHQDQPGCRGLVSRCRSRLVRVMPTSTEKNNNTSPTAASASTDLNGTAALRACEILKQRLAETAARHLAGPTTPPPQPTLRRSRFERGAVFDRRRPDRRLSFGELVRLAYEDRVDLGARGFLRHARHRFRSRDRARHAVPAITRTARPFPRS